MIHGRDGLIERYLSGAIPARRQPRRVDRFDGPHGVEVEAGNLDESPYRVAGQSKIVHHYGPGSACEQVIGRLKCDREPRRGD